MQEKDAASVIKNPEQQDVPQAMPVPDKDLRFEI